MLLKVFFCTEDYSCTIRDVELNGIFAVLPWLTNNREEYLVRWLKAVKATKDMIIGIEYYAMVTCPSCADSVVLITL